ncbi:MAG TPA: thiamine pyrophosphate-dependent enzyme, partial [Alphaproteobacteria bacterium]|nr:thiamine pyrophosphate-dependent enzyme [Alphaproteobacteria bacterium]
TRETLRRAIDIALTPPRGPVYLSLPGDVATQPDEDRAGAGLSIEPSPPTDQHAVGQIQAALNRAKRPGAVVGIALDQRKDAPGVRSFLAHTGIPYADTPKTKGLVDPTADAFLGTCLSASGDALIAEFLRQCDFILGLGFDPVESVHDWHLAQNYYAVTNASTDFETYRPHVQVVGDVSAVLSQLTQEYNGKPAWQASDGTRVRASVQAAITPAVSATNAGLAPYYVARVMRDILPSETRLSVDTGSHKLLFAQAWQTGEPLTYFNSNGLSSMGLAVPGAIALALLDPARPTVGVAGDGGFGMMVQELETVNRLGLAPLFVVLCDQALSLIRIPQQQRGYEPSGVDFAEVDWATVAEGFGVRGLWARTPDELAHALTAWREEPQATVLAVQVDEALYCGHSY